MDNDDDQYARDGCVSCYIQYFSYISFFAIVFVLRTLWRQYKNIICYRVALHCIINCTMVPFLQTWFFNQVSNCQYRCFFLNFLFFFYCLRIECRCMYFWLCVVSLQFGRFLGTEKLSMSSSNKNLLQNWILSDWISVSNTVDEYSKTIKQMNSDILKLFVPVRFTLTIIDWHFLHAVLILLSFYVVLRDIQAAE